MKKTNFFLLFTIAFVAGISLPNDIFVDDQTGYAFRAVLLVIGLLMNTIALYHKTENLMSVRDANNNTRMVHWVRLLAVLMSLLSIIFLLVMFINKTVDSDGRGFYKTVFYCSVFLLLTTVFGIFISNDIEGKKKPVT